MGESDERVDDDVPCTRGSRRGSSKDCPLSLEKLEDVSLRDLVDFPLSESLRRVAWSEENRGAEREPPRRAEASAIPKVSMAKSQDN